MRPDRRMHPDGSLGDVYRIRPSAQVYGAPLGIVMLDFRSPFIPGDVGNASTFSFPVMYRTVPGLSVSAILADSESQFAEPVAEAARDLVESGAGAVTSNCGFMLRYQQKVCEAVAPTPVLLSSLLQLPIIAATTAPGQTIGIITADATVLTVDLIESLMGPIGRPLAIVGLQDAPSFRYTMFDGGPTLDAAAIGQEAAAAAAQLREDNPALAAILLECAALPAYAHLVQRVAGGVPVYDFTTLVDLVHHARFRTAFHGYY
ncbi:MAG TPA: hypothetical protein VK028_08085 [Micromonosporaceae bacterium]|nr:hypothetical protein [Micromonosporaceae bacterium]